MKVVEHLPKNPKKDEEHTLKTKRDRLVTFRATGKKGFGKWRIISNKPA